MTMPQSRYAEVEPDLEEIAQMWGGGWRRYFFPAFWLVYLGQAGSGVAKHSDGLAAITGYVLLAAFAVVYLAALPMGWGRHGRVFWPLFALRGRAHRRGVRLRPRGRAGLLRVPGRAGRRRPPPGDVADRHRVHRRHRPAAAVRPGLER